MHTVLAVPGTDNLGEKEIIDRILAGEKRLFELIIRKYNARLFRVGMAILNNDAEVEDAMQTSYINAYEHLADFKGKAGFGTWLTRILINESLLQLKKRKRAGAVNILLEERPEPINKTAMQTPLSTVLNKELARVLEGALAELPEKYRIVFVLREMEELSIAETIQTLDISEANVKTRLSRAKSMLRDQLEGYYKNDAVYHFHLIRCDRIVERVFSALNI